jgi:hypothetical protein
VEEAATAVGVAVVVASAVAAAEAVAVAAVVDSHDLLVAGTTIWMRRPSEAATSLWIS